MIINCYFQSNLFVQLRFFLSDRGWVGWKNERRDHVEILFEFGEVREFHAVELFVNNQFTREVAIFKELHAYFSVGGKIFGGEPVTFTPLSDEIFEEPRNITAKLHRRVGRFVKLRLFFASKWLLVSEVEFDSAPARGNYTEEAAAEGSGTLGEIDAKRGIETGGQAAGASVIQSTSPGEPSSGPAGVTNAAAAPPNKSESADLALMPIIVGSLTTVIILLAAIIFFIVSRSRQRKQQQWGTKTSVVECSSASSSGLPPSSAEKMALHPGAEPLLHYSYFAETPGSESGSNSGSRSVGGGSRKAPLVDDNYNCSPRPLFGSPRTQRAASTAAVGGGGGVYAGRPGGGCGGGSCRTSPALRRATPLSTPRLAAAGRHTGTPRRRIISNPMAEPPLYMEPYHAMRYSPYVRCEPSEFAVSRETAILSGKFGFLYSTVPFNSDVSPL
jgi:hypothetical protein